MPLGAWKTAEAAAVTMITIARAAARGGGAIRQYSFFLCIGETGLEWSVQSVQGKEGTKTLEIIQVKLYATPPATTTSLARSLATGPGTT